MKKILFNDNYGLTQAVLSGRKTQTRRIIKYENMIACHWNPKLNAKHLYYTDERGKCQLIDADTNKIIVPAYNVGEVVAIAQSYKSIFEEDCRRSKDGKTMFNICINNACDKPGWNNKMFVRAELMPHHIRITDVKVERLQDISDEDCIKEGIFMYGGDDAYIPRYFYDYPNNRGDGFDTPREAYASLIDKVSGKGTWQSNPFVFVYEFELVK